MTEDTGTDTGTDTDDGAETTNGGTTDTDYRWKWLTTLWSLGYGLGFPAAVGAAQASGAGYPPGTLTGVLVTAWLATVVYVIGPENVEAVKELRGGGA